MGLGGVVPTSFVDGVSDDDDDVADVWEVTEERYGDTLQFYIIVLYIQPLTFSSNTTRPSLYYSL